MSLWQSLLALLASVSAEPSALEHAHPPAAAAVAVAYAAAAPDVAPEPPAPPKPPAPAPKPPCPCGGLGRVLKAGPGGVDRIERCPCGACPDGTCPRPSGA